MVERLMKKILFLLLLISSLAFAEKPTLYQRLGGYDKITSLLTDFHIRLKNDIQLGRFWKYRSIDGKERELQLLVDFVCSHTGGPVHYSGRDMPTSHIGMMISESDWKIFIRLLKESMKKYDIKGDEEKEVLSFMDSLKSSMVEVK